MAEKTVAPPNEGGAATQAKEGTRAQEQYVAPPVDIYEIPEGLVLMVDMPGVTTEGLSVHVHDDILTIQGRTQVSLPGQPIYREFELVSFFREFQLADTVDATKIKAEMRNGVLNLTLPKAEAAKPKQIQVQVG